MKNIHYSIRLLLVCGLATTIGSTAYAAATPSKAQTAAKSCLEGKNWLSDTFGREVISPKLQIADRPAPTSSVFLLDPSVGGLATFQASTRLRFTNGKLTGSSAIALAGVSSQTGGVRGESAATLNSKYALSITKKGAITINIKKVTLDEARSTIYILKFSTNEKLNSVQSVQTPVFLKDVVQLKASCKGKTLTLFYPDGSQYTLTR